MTSAEIISILIASPALLLTAGVRVPKGSERFHDPAKDQVKITLTLWVKLLVINGNMTQNALFMSQQINIVITHI